MPTVPECFAILGSICSCFRCIITGVTVLLAILGWNKWRKEMKAKAKLDIGRKIAPHAKRFGNEMEMVRHPNIFPWEYEERPKLRHEAHEGEKIRNESFARKNRLDKAQRTLQELHEACWEAEFVFGEDMNAYIRPLAEAYQKLFDSITGYFADQLHRGGQKHPDKTHSAYYIVYSEDEDDEFGASLETNIKDLVEFVNKQVES